VFNAAVFIGRYEQYEDFYAGMNWGMGGKHSIYYIVVYCARGVASHTAPNTMYMPQIAARYIQQTQTKHLCTLK
jgi:hypothetical protein